MKKSFYVPIASNVPDSDEIWLDQCSTRRRDKPFTRACCHLIHIGHLTKTEFKLLIHSLPSPVTDIPDIYIRFVNTMSK